MSLPSLPNSPLGSSSLRAFASFPSSPPFLRGRIENQAVLHKTISKRMQSIEILLEENLLPNADLISHVWNMILHEISTIKSHKKSGSIINRRSVIKNLTFLGLKKEDLQARKGVLEIIRKLAFANFQIEPFDDSDLYSGVYRIYDGRREPFAVFKIGAKRARIEVFVRRLSFLLGLEECVVPRIFCAMDKLVSPNDVFEDLWNSNIKIAKPQSAVGILEPFIVSDPSDSSRDPELSFAKLVLFAAAILGGDLKSDGVVNQRIFVDTEECMGVQGRSLVSPLEVPFVLDERLQENPFLQSFLSKSSLSKLKSIVFRWNIPKIMQEVQEEEIVFEDKKAERLECDEEGLDDQNNPVFIDTPSDQDKRRVFFPIRADLADNRKMFTDEQVTCLRLRLESIKKLCKEKQNIRPIDLLFVVDPVFQRQYHELKSLPDNVLRGHSPCAELGRRTPDELKRRTLNVRPSPLGVEQKNSEENTLKVPSTFVLPSDCDEAFSVDETDDEFEIIPGQFFMPGDIKNLFEKKFFAPLAKRG